MKRILIIGTSGVGKSTLAQRLSNHLQVPFFASDQFYWEPGWKVSSPEKVRGQVMGVIAREAWILDGNFDDERKWVWQRADCIIWLDYSLMTICRRIVFRNFQWLFSRQSTWSGNRMTLARAISGIRHAVKSYSLKKQNYPHWLAELSDAVTHRFYDSHETEEWLKSLKRAVE